MRRRRPRNTEKRPAASPEAHESAAGPPEARRGGSREMAFWDHVYELRRRLLLVAVVALACGAAAYFFYPVIFAAIREVLAGSLEGRLYITEIAEGFLTRLKVSAVLGLLGSLPLLLFEATVFVFPALRRRERVFLLTGVMGTFLLFGGGVAFAYAAVLPLSVRFLGSSVFFPDRVSPLLSYGRFIHFFFQFLVGFGLCFEFPVVILLLLKFGAVSMRRLISVSRYVVVGCFLVAAILTPPDVASQLLLALPMLVLYGLTLVIGKLLGLGRQGGAETVERADDVRNRPW